MGSNPESRQVFVDYCCHSSSTSYNGEQIKDKKLSEEWMDENGQEGSMQTPGIHMKDPPYYDQD